MFLKENWNYLGFSLIILTLLISIMFFQRYVYIKFHDVFNRNMEIKPERNW